jgi:hypothetical protein
MKLEKGKLKRWIFVIVIIIIVLLLFKKCGSGIKMVDRKPGDLKIETSYHVPINATAILSLNLQNIIPEIGFLSLIQTQPYKNKLAQSYPANPAFTNVFADPVGNGINVSQKAIFYLDVGESDEEVYTASLMCMADKNKFFAMLQKTPTRDLKKSEFYESADLGNNNTVAWSQDFVMFLTSNPGFDVHHIFQQVFNPRAEKYFDRSTDYLAFTEHSKSDAAFWIDLGSYARNQLHATGKPGELPGMLLDGNVVFGDLDFETGYFTTDVKFKLNNILTEGIKGFFKDDKDRSITKYVPLENPSFVANLSLNIDGIFSFLLRDSEVKIEARNSLVEYGLLVDDFGKALTGDVLLAGFPNDTTTKSSVLFGLKIKDNDYFFKLLKVMEDVGQIEMVENNLYKMNKGVIPFFPLLATYEDKLQRLMVKDGYVFMSLDRRLIDAIKSSTSNTNVIPPYLLPMNDQYNYLSFFGNESFGETSSYSERFSIRDYSINYNGSSLEIKCNLKNNQVSSLKQMLQL